MPKAPSKAARKRTRKTARTTDRGGGRSVVGTDASAPSAAPAAPAAYQAPEDRQARIERVSLLRVAHMRCHQARPKGQRNKCWLLDQDLRERLASEHVLDAVSAAELHRRHHAALAKPHAISLTGLTRWLDDIRSAYQDEYARSNLLDTEHEISEVDREAFRSGDLVALLGTTFSRLSPMMLAYANRVLAAAPSKDEMGSVLRFVEAITAAAKVQSDAKHKELQSLLLSIRAELAGGSKSKTQRDRTDTIKHLGKVIDDYMMGRAA